MKTETLRVQNVVDATRFGCMVASRGGYRMARGWHYAKLSLSNASASIFLWHVYFVILVPFSLSFLLVCVFLLLSLELGRCSSDLFLSSRPRTGLATVYYWVWLRPDWLM